MSRSPCWKPDARQVSESASAPPPRSSKGKPLPRTHTKKNHKKMLLVLLDAILLQAGNVASPALINPFGIQPIIRIQEVQSFKIQDVSAALRS